MSVNVIFFAKLTAVFWCFILVLAADKLKTNAKTQKGEDKNNIECKNDEGIYSRKDEYRIRYVRIVRISGINTIKLKEQIYK